MSNYFKGSLMRKIRTAEDYVQLVESVREDVFDLRQSIDSDGKEMAEVNEFIDTLEQYIEALYQSFKDGTYQFADEDLPFMPAVKNNNHTAFLPILHSLKEINRIHRYGLDAD